MDNLKTTPSRLGRCLLGVLDAALIALIWIWLANNPFFQIMFILAAFLLVLLLLVLSVAAWRHGFRWLVSRRALRFYGWLVVGIVSVIVLFYAEERWRGKRAWAALEREAAARGESLELSSVIPPPVPDDENFALAPGVPRLLGYADWKTGEPRETPDRTSLPFYHGDPRDWPTASWAFGQATDLAAWQKFFRRHQSAARTNTSNSPSLEFPVTPKPQTPAADVLLALSRYDSALALLRAADRRPQVRYPLPYDEGWFAVQWPSLLPAGSLRSAAHILCLRAVAELAQDQTNAAFDDTLLALRLTDSLRQVPYAAMHEIRAQMIMLCLQPVWEGLARHRWNDQQLATLQERFASMDLLADFQVAARGETIMLMNLADQFHAFLEGHPSAWGKRIERDNESGDRFWRWFFRIAYPAGWLYQDKAWTYHFYERRDNVTKALDLDHQHRWSAELLSATDPALLVLVIPRLMETFHERSRQSVYLQTACQEASVACALERYRLAHGQYPAALEDLVPASLTHVPTDLLAPDAAPLHYRRESDGGFTLYSVGLNRVDDQGKPAEASPPSGDWYDSPVHLPRLDHGDWVWRQPGL